MRTLSMWLLLAPLVAPLLGQDRKAVTVATDTKPLGPYSPAIVCGDLVYVSGTIGQRGDGRGVPMEFGAQLHQALANLSRVLHAAESALERSVRMTVFVADPRHQEAAAELLKAAFPPTTGPACTVVTADLPHPDAAIEIDIVAARSDAATSRTAFPEAWSETFGSRTTTVGDTVFAAGQSSRDLATGELSQGDITAQTARALGNLGAALAETGLGLTDVTEATVFLADARDFAKFNQVWRTFFPSAPPCRATVRARSRTAGNRIVVQATACVDGDARIATTAEGAPFSSSVVTRDRVYLAGFVGRGADGAFAPGDVKAQTAATLDRAAAELARHGLDFDDVLVSRVFLTDMRTFGTMNGVYAGELSAPRPTRTTVGTLLMAPAAWVEIQMVARRRRP